MSCLLLAGQIKINCPALTGGPSRLGEQLLVRRAIKSSTSKPALLYKATQFKLSFPPPTIFRAFGFKSLVTPIPRSSSLTEILFLT